MTPVVRHGTIIIGPTMLLMLSAYHHEVSLNHCNHDESLLHLLQVAPVMAPSDWLEERPVTLVDWSYVFMESGL